MFRDADPTQVRGKVLSAADLLRQAERRVHERSDVNPETQLELLAIIGESLFGLQENADAARVIEQALHLQESARIADDGLQARLRLALSQTYEYLGKHQDARRELDRSFAALTKSGNTSSRLFLQAKLHQSALGIVLSDYPAAERAAREAIAIASSTPGPTSVEMATALQQLSHVFTLTQRRELAVDPARQSFTMLLELYARDLTHPKVMESTLYYAQALNAVGDFEAAFELYGEALAKASRVFGDDSRLVGESLSALVPLEVEIGALQPAVAHARRALDIYLRDGQTGSARTPVACVNWGVRCLPPGRVGKRPNGSKRPFSCRWARNLSSTCCTPAGALDWRWPSWAGSTRPIGSCDRPLTRADRRRARTISR